MKKKLNAGLSSFFRKVPLLAVLLLVTLFFFHCAGQAGTSAEKLIGISFNFDRNEVNLIVVSKGCTGKSDFAFSVKENTISIQRKKKDECKAMPEALVLTYTFKEAGLDPNKEYTVSNSFIANPNLADVR